MGISKQKPKMHIQRLLGRDIFNQILGHWLYACYKRQAKVSGKRWSKEQDIHGYMDGEVCSGALSEWASPSFLDKSPIPEAATGIYSALTVSFSMSFSVTACPWICPAVTIFFPG